MHDWWIEREEKGGRDSRREGGTPGGRESRKKRERDDTKKIQNHCIKMQNSLSIIICMCTPTHKLTLLGPYMAVYHQFSLLVYLCECMQLAKQYRELAHLDIQMSRQSVIGNPLMCTHHAYSIQMQCISVTCQQSFYVINDEFRL